MADKERVPEEHSLVLAENVLEMEAGVEKVLLTVKEIVEEPEREWELEDVMEPENVGVRVGVEDTE